MIANARENLSDEQLKQVTGGARINSRPEAPEDHLIGHGDLDQHGAATLDGHPLVPPKQSMELPSLLFEQIAFSSPVAVQGLKDSSGNAITGIDRIVDWQNAVWAFTDDGARLYLGDDSPSGVGVQASQTIINDAVAQGDQIAVVGVEDLPVSLPNNR